MNLRRNCERNHSAGTDIATNTWWRINIVLVVNIKEINSLNRYAFLGIARSTFE